jgi:hypothetical protein
MFMLTGFDSAQPPGAYMVETDEQVLDTVTRLALRRLETRIEIYPRPGKSESVPIDPAELEHALLRDAGDDVAGAV